MAWFKKSGRSGAGRGESMVSQLKKAANLLAKAAAKAAPKRRSSSSKRWR